MPFTSENRSTDQMEEAIPARLSECRDAVFRPVTPTRAMVLLPRRLVGPVDDQRASLDLVQRQEAPEPAVAAVVSIISHHEQLARGDLLGAPVVAQPLGAK